MFVWKRNLGLICVGDVSSWVKTIGPSSADCFPPVAAVEACCFSLVIFLVAAASYFCSYSSNGKTISLSLSSPRLALLSSNEF